MKSLFFTLSLLFFSDVNAYYYYLNSKVKKNTTTTYRHPYPISTHKRDTKFGDNLASGFSRTYPQSYIHILSHCFGLTTNLQKLVLNGLRSDDNLTTKRLKCYTVGLGKDLNEFSFEDKNALEIATESSNQTAIDFITRN